MTDLGLVLELIPDNCGTAAALAIQSPSESIGFVIGSVLISMSLWAFPIPERDKGRTRCGRFRLRMRVKVEVISGWGNGWGLRSRGWRNVFIFESGESYIL